jgi:hypothetical protein
MIRWQTMIRSPILRLSAYVVLLTEYYSSRVVVYYSVNVYVLPDYHGLCPGVVSLMYVQYC